MTRAIFQPFSPNNFTVVMVALVAAAVAGAGFPNFKPNHIECRLVQLDNHPNLFLGDPGAGPAQTKVCELRFYNTKNDNFIKLNWQNASSGYVLSGWPADANTDGATQIPTRGVTSMMCRVAAGQVVPGGNRICRYSLWQLSPSSAGVALRLTFGSSLTAYTLQPAPIPSQAHQIPQ